MKKRGETLFLALGLGLCALLMTASLLLDVRTAVRSDQCVSTLETIRMLRRENESLRARWACSLSLEEIGRYAEEELGMQQLSSEQILIPNPEN